MKGFSCGRDSPHVFVRTALASVCFRARSGIRGGSMRLPRQGEVENRALRVSAHAGCLARRDQVSRCRSLRRRTWSVIKEACRTTVRQEPSFDSPFDHPVRRDVGATGVRLDAPTHTHTQETPHLVPDLAWRPSRDCTYDSDCADGRGERCVSHRCTLASEGCEPGSSDCPAGERCTSLVPPAGTDCAYTFESLCVAGGELEAHHPRAECLPSSFPRMIKAWEPTWGSGRFLFQRAGEHRAGTSIPDKVKLSPFVGPALVGTSGEGRTNGREVQRRGRPRSDRSRPRRARIWTSMGASVTIRCG